MTTTRVDPTSDSHTDAVNAALVDIARRHPHEFYRFTSTRPDHTDLIPKAIEYFGIQVVHNLNTRGEWSITANYSIPQSLIVQAHVTDIQSFDHRVQSVPVEPHHEAAIKQFLMEHFAPHNEATGVDPVFYSFAPLAAMQPLAAPNCQIVVVNHSMGNVFPEYFVTREYPEDFLDHMHTNMNVDLLPLHGSWYHNGIHVYRVGQGHVECLNPLNKPCSCLRPDE